MRMKRNDGTAVRWALPVAVMLMVAVSVACAASPPKDEAQKPLGHVLKKTVLLFPFDVPSTMAPNAEALSVLLTDVAASRLVASGGYSVTTFYRAWPPVARLHNDQQLSEADIVPPYAEDNRKGLKIGKLVGYDMICLGSVDDYQYSESDKQVTLTVSARLLTVETGQVLKNVTLSATSSKGTEKSKEEELNMEAGRQSMDKIMAQLAPVAALPTAVETAKPATPKKKHNNDWLWALLVVGLGLGIGLSSGGGGNGGGIDTPPPPPSH